MKLKDKVKSTIAKAQQMGLYHQNRYYQAALISAFDQRYLYYNTQMGECLGISDEQVKRLRQFYKKQAKIDPEIENIKKQLQCLL